MGTRVPETTSTWSTSSTRQETNSLFSKTRTTISTSKKVATIPSRPGRSCSGKKEPRSTDSGLRNKETGKTYPCRKRKICTAVTSTVPSWNSTRERTCGGIIGIIMISVALATQIDYMLCYNVFGWNPKEAGFWYWWQPGWQQMRKNEAAEHILWEYDAMGNQRDYQHWDYVNHQWKRPCMPRLDASY